MPYVDLETLINVNEPTALDPFGLLNDRERAAMQEMLVNDDSLPMPGSVLPLSWDPTPSTAPRTPTSIYSRLCYVCTPRGRQRIGRYIVGRNIGTRLNDHLPPGAVVCQECRNRRARFTNRYSFYPTSGYCINHPLEGATYYVTYLEPNRAIRGITLCGMCETAERHNGTRMRALRYG